jgi:hypothetical protein
MGVRDRVKQIWIVVRNDEANTKRAEQEEQGEAIEDAAECARHIVSGVLGFAGGHRDVVWTCRRAVEKRKK